VDGGGTEVDGVSGRRDGRKWHAYRISRCDSSDATANGPPHTQKSRLKGRDGSRRTSISERLSD
jgi:hypothetical protein